jgi:hypothetical protein
VGSVISSEQLWLKTGLTQEEFPEKADFTYKFYQQIALLGGKEVVALCQIGLSRAIEKPPDDPQSVIIGSWQ